MRRLETVEDCNVVAQLLAARRANPDRIPPVHAHGGLLFLDIAPPDASVPLLRAISLSAARRLAEGASVASVIDREARPGPEGVPPLPLAGLRRYRRQLRYRITYALRRQDLDPDELVRLLLAVTCGV